MQGVYRPGSTGAAGGYATRQSVHTRRAEGPGWRNARQEKARSRRALEEETGWQVRLGLRQERSHPVFIVDRTIPISLKVATRQKPIALI